MYPPLFRFSTLLLFALSSSAARWPSFGTLQTTQSSGVLNVVINNTFSSINVLDFHLQADLANLVEELQASDTDVRVVVFSSANKEFFMAHIDIASLQPGFGACLARTRGVGNEFLMSCDMRFASTSPSVLLGQLENSLGANPGAGGEMYLSRLIGRGLTFEYVLSSADVDARTAERVGWINKAFDTSAELKQYVKTLAERIALFPAAGIAGTKRGINAVSRPPREVIVRDAQNVFLALAASPESQALQRKFISATHNQSIGELELNYGDALFELYKDM
ncbi:ClpP/crotonase-like domain-containing protein [Mycena crocata]|nr:ClpP/crotonase-like domain-containing protein [Mycena crocata]